MILDEAQRAAYQRDGFLVLPGFVDEGWLARLRATTAEFIEQSRALTESTRVFDLEPDHSATKPRLRRLVSPADLSCGAVPMGIS